MQSWSNKTRNLSSQEKALFTFQDPRASLTWPPSSITLVSLNHIWEYMMNNDKILPMDTDQQKVSRCKKKIVKFVPLSDDETTWFLEMAQSSMQMETSMFYSFSKLNILVYSFKS